MIAENNRVAWAIGAVLTSYLASRDPTKMNIGEVLSLADLFSALTRNAIAAHETLHKTAGMPAPGMGRDDDGNLLNGEIHLPERRSSDLDRIVAEFEEKLNPVRRKKPGGRIFRTTAASNPSA